MSLSIVLAELLQGAASLLPRLAVVPFTDHGVFWTRGEGPRFLQPGTYWYWPLWTDFDTVNTEQEKTLSPEQGALTTKDEYIVQVDTMVVYRVKDHTKWFLVGEDMEETLSEVVMRVVREYVTDLEFSYLHTEAGDELTSELQSHLGRYGVQVISAGPTSFAATQHFTLSHPLS